MSKSESKAFKGVVGRTPNQKKFIQTVNDPQYTHILMQDKDYVLLKNQAFTPSL